MSKFFLLIALLALTCTFGHWLWRDGENALIERQGASAAAIANILQYPPEGQTSADLRLALRQSFIDTPDLALIVLSDQSRAPLLITSRLLEEELKWIQNILARDTAAEELAAYRHTLHSREILLTNNRRASLRAVYDDTLIAKHRERILVITVLSAGLVIFLWTIIAVLIPRSLQKNTPEADAFAKQSEAGEPKPPEKIAEAPPAIPAASTEPPPTALPAVSTEPPPPPRPREPAEAPVHTQSAFENIVKEKCLDPRALPLAIIMGSIDRLDEIHENFGSQTKDDTLIKADILLKKHLPKRASCRRDQETFAIAIPKCDLAEAMDIAEELRMRLASANLLPRGAISASFGVSVDSEGSEAQACAIIRRAENALRFSREHGGDMVSSNKDYSPSSARI